MKDNDQVLRLEHQCPQCGAPIGMLEIDHILACPYCRTRLFMQWPDGINRYYLPSSAGSGVFYVPYRRFRGSSVRLTRDKEYHGLLDTTAVATRRKEFPKSVGIRAQTIKGRLVGGTLGAPFLKTEVPIAEFLASLGENQKPDTIKLDPGNPPPERIINDYYSGKNSRHEMIFTSKGMKRKRTEDGRFLAQLTQLYGPNSAKKSVEYHAFIGETISILYFPYYVENDHLHDGLTGRRLSKFPSSEIPSTDRRCPGEGVRFQPALCPHCGWDLEGNTQSLLLICRNCLSAWRAGGKRITEVSYGHWECAFKPQVWIPFWTLRIDSQKIPLSTVGDFMMIANPYTRFSAAAPESPMRFLMPAFKIHPAQLLRIASAMTVNQRPTRPPDHKSHREPHFPVTLPYEEAFQAVHLLMASLCRRRKKYFELSGPENYRSLIEASLAYVPFARRGFELIQPDINYSIQARALEHGTNL